MTTAVPGVAAEPVATPPTAPAPPGAGATPARRRRSSAAARRDTIVSLWLVLPGILLVGLFLIYPLIETVRLAFVDWPGLGPETFVGLANFEEMLGDADVLTAVRNNLLFAVIVTVGTVGLGTAFALAIDNRVPLWRTYRFAFFLPHVLPGAIIAIMWSNALDPNFGWITGVIRLVDPTWSFGFLNDPGTAIYALCLITVWGGAGFPMVIVLGGLRNIPPEVIEAARLDGATPLQIALRISVPLCKDVIATVTLLQLIFSFKVFDIVQALTRGGPGSSTQVFGTLIYREAFERADFGYASAIALVATVVIVAISLGYLALVRPGRIERNG